ncbi:hypothetical protein [Maridesulfovibrio frigidus]|uniref:hypothetical protein n=1 Tax=Maridesulfovibrio frigidus TaxID=340956 RepID=UPI0004E0D607|nr:hypothetical protein [Maridesulfovibrio frigidus]
MTGEGVEALIIMLVIVFAIFHMVRKSSRNVFDATTLPEEDTANVQESADVDSDKVKSKE